MPSWAYAHFGSWRFDEPVDPGISCGEVEMNSRLSNADAGGPLAKSERAAQLQGGGYPPHAESA